MAETNVIRVRYWAAAKAAAGADSDELPVDGPITLAEVGARGGRAAPRHPARGGARGLLHAGRRPAGRHRGPGDVVVEPGPVVEFLPPFAGG